MKMRRSADMKSLEAEAARSGITISWERYGGSVKNLHIQPDPLLQRNYDPVRYEIGFSRDGVEVARRRLAKNSTLRDVAFTAKCALATLTAPEAAEPAPEVAAPRAAEHSCECECGHRWDVEDPTDLDELICSECGAEWD